MSVEWALKITPNHVGNWVVPRVHNHYSFPKIKQSILIYNHISSIFFCFFRKKLKYTTTILKFFSKKNQIYKVNQPMFEHVMVQRSLNFKGWVG